MQRVNHKKYGVGEVIRKEVQENGSYITVRFDDGRESRFSIPGSFVLGVLTAEGSLKEEVETAVSDLHAREQEQLKKLQATAAVPHRSSASRVGRKAPKPVEVKGPVETAYEQYLIEVGYETETPKGAPSTVYAYSGAIARHVLEEEHITWEALRDHISRIVLEYGEGGAKEEIGAISNRTVINALRRFEEFVNLA